MIELNGNTLTINQMKEILYKSKTINIAESSMKKIKKSKSVVESIVAGEKTDYGINTGFGKFSNMKIAENNVEELQLNLIRSHSCGVGDPFPRLVSKAMMVLRLNALVKGYSGVGMEVVEMLTELINNDIIPVIPQQGSLGASGDLAPLALVLIGEGKVMNESGDLIDSLAALKKHNLKPITLQAKDGLALINGTQTMTAMGIINFIEAEKIALDSEWIAGMTIEALQGIVD